MSCNVLAVNPVPSDGGVGESGRTLREGVNEALDPLDLEELIENAADVINANLCCGAQLVDVMDALEGNEDVTDEGGDDVTDQTDMVDDVTDDAFDDDVTDEPDMEDDVTDEAFDDDVTDEPDMDDDVTDETGDVIDDEDEALRASVQLTLEGEINRVKQFYFCIPNLIYYANSAAAVITMEHNAP